MKKTIFALVAVVLLFSCNKDSSPDPFFRVTISGDGITDSLFFDATSSIGKVGDSIEVVSGDGISAFRIAVPLNNTTGSYTPVLFAPGSTDAQLFYSPDVAATGPDLLLKLSLADSGIINITRIDDEGTENLIDGDFNVRTQNLNGDTLRMHHPGISLLFYSPSDIKHYALPRILRCCQRPAFLTQCIPCLLVLQQ
jgi:hypothetical protein